MYNKASNPAIRSSQNTPRNSGPKADVAVQVAKETPWRTLSQLANIPRTPLGRASSAGPPSTHRSSHRTPNVRSPNQKIGSARRVVALTPHGRAAQRGLDLRRAGLTPGKYRRNNGRQRETPRDTLRALSRLLGPKSELIARTPNDPAESSGIINSTVPIDWEDGPDIERPSLSLPIEDDEDEDSSLNQPPRSSGLEDEDFTIQSVELGRRFHSEQPLGRLSRGSFGSLRMSGGFGDQDFDRMGDAYDSSIIAEPIAGGDDSLPFTDEEVLR